MMQLFCQNNTLKVHVVSKYCALISSGQSFWDGSISFQRTAQRQQRREFPTVVYAGGIRGTRHPEVFVDGGGGDDAPVHGGSPPVAVGQAHPHHHPTDEAQHQSHYFHDRIHDPAKAQQSSERVSSPDRSFVLMIVLLRASAW